MRKAQWKRAVQAGFTLVEVMVVIVILGMLAAIVSTSVLGRAAEAEVRTAKMQVLELKDAVTMFIITNGRRPESWDEMIEPDSTTGERWIDTTEPPKDPWGNEYEIRPGERAKQFEIVSYGPDGQEGTDDDISSLTAKNK